MVRGQFRRLRGGQEAPPRPRQRHPASAEVQEVFAVRGAQLEAAEAALLEFESFAGARTRRLPHCASAGAHAAELARDPELKFSAADALHLALSAEGRHRLVTFDARLADSTRAAGFDAEIPSGAIEYAPILAALEFWPSMARITNGGGDEHPETPPSTAVPAGGW